MRARRIISRLASTGLRDLKQSPVRDELRATLQSPAVAVGQGDSKPDLESHIHTMEISPTYEFVASEVAGMSSFRPWSANYKMKLQNGSEPTMSIERLLQNFDDVWEKTGVTGIPSCIIATQALASRFPGLGLQIHLQHQGSAFDKQLPLIFNRVHLDGRVVTVIRMPAMQARDLSPKSSQVAAALIPKVSIDLGIRNHRQSSQVLSHSRNSGVAAVDELKRLHKQSQEAVRRLYNQVTFSTWENFAKHVAQALVLVVQPQDPRLEVCSARVTLHAVPQLERQQITAWASVKQEHSQKIADTESDRPPVSSVPGLSSSQNRDDAQKQPSYAKDDKMTAIEGSSDPSGSIAPADPPSSSSAPSWAAEQKATHSATSKPATLSSHKGGVYIALGSNMGDRLENIEKACNMIDADPDMRILRTSALYETDPMYVQDQGRFLNGACEIATTLEPLELLDRLQAIEKELGRVKVVEKGPRTIDLDIIMYREQTFKHERLIVPHPLMHERDFVLRPLADLDAARHQIVPGSHKSISEVVKAMSPRVSTQALWYTRLTPDLHFGPRGLQDSQASEHGKTYPLIMSILNVTPDSFSDGGRNVPTDATGLVETVRSHVMAGASIIDVGGQSSRPNAPDISADEEIARILPAIEAIKACPEAANVAISVDTYRAVVAEAAVKAGAHVVNDISAGQLDPEMLSTVARLGCTYIMMHMRGTPATMQSDENCTYRNGHVVNGVYRELQARMNAAESAGIRRWRMILDPGIGFSKTINQNLELLKHMHAVTSRIKNMPWLVGSSRKSFIGKITGVTEPKDRVSGTAVTVVAAMRGGASIVRVHDVAEMAAVVRMYQAIEHAEPIG